MIIKLLKMLIRLLRKYERWLEDKRHGAQRTKIKKKDFLLENI